MVILLEQHSQSTFIEADKLSLQPNHLGELAIGKWGRTSLGSPLDIFAQTFLAMPTFQHHLLEL